MSRVLINAGVNTSDIIYTSCFTKLFQVTKFFVTVSRTHTQSVSMLCLTQHSSYLAHIQSTQHLTYTQSLSTYTLTHSLTHTQHTYPVTQHTQPCTHTFAQHKCSSHLTHSVTPHTYTLTEHTVIQHNLSLNMHTHPHNTYIHP